MIFCRIFPRLRQSRSQGPAGKSGLFKDSVSQERAGRESRAPDCLTPTRSLSLCLLYRLPGIRHIGANLYFLE